jgi:photosystem II stability/assembly factor-like uncharacterized protein
LGGLVALALTLDSNSLSDSDFQGLDDPKSAPSDWLLTQRLYPYWRADPAAYADAVEQTRQLRKTSSFSDWKPWSFSGPMGVGGRITDIEFNPRSPDTVYAAAATGGVFLSTDGGSNWKPIFDDQAAMSIGDIAVDPSNPSIVYVGTGEANGGHNNLPGSGLFRSTDGGATWEQSGLEGSVSIARVVIDPLNTNRLFVAVVGSYFAPGAERGIYKSEDGGGSWSQIFAPGDDIGAIDLVIHPNRPDTLFAAMWERVRSYNSIKLSGLGSAVYRSKDGGESWGRLGALTGLPEGPQVGRIGLALCESNPEVLYAAINDGRQYLGLYRSNDGGDSWEDADRLRQARAATSNFSWYFGQIRVHPDDPDDVYFLDVRLANSKDGGQSWRLTGRSLHVDFHAMAFRPDDPALSIVGTDGGIGISNDFGQTWREVTELPITQFYQVAVGQTASAPFFGGTQDNGTQRLASGDSAWTPVLGGDGFEPLIHFTDSNIVYLQTQRGGLVKSRDQGRSSFPVATPSRGIPSDEPRNWSTPVAMDPADPEVLYYGTNRVYRSADGAGTWQAASPILPRAEISSPRLGTVTSISVSMVDSTVIWAGTDDGRVWRGSPAVEDWTDVTTGLPDRWVTKVLADRSDPMTAFVTFSGLKWKDEESHVFKTVNGGESWVDISSNLPDVPLNTILQDSRNLSTLSVGSDIGAFVSLDGGEAWQSLDIGMPRVAVYDLDIHELSRTLFASTHGRSIYALDLTSQPDSIEVHLPGSPRPRLDVWPNPSAGDVWLAVLIDPDTGLQDPGAMGQVPRLQVFDITGRHVRTMELEGSARSGILRVRWDGRTDGNVVAPPGVYLAKVLLPGMPDVSETATIVRLR